MPEMDGLEVVRAIRGDPELNPKLVLMRGLRPDEAVQGETGRGYFGVEAHKSRSASRQLAQGARHRVHAGYEWTRDAVRSRYQRDGGIREDLDRRGQRDQPEGRRHDASAAGYLVETVNDGSDAVQAVKDDQYDAILMDCQMPGLNGYQATAAIRALEGSVRHTPIIALTAGARPEDQSGVSQREWMDTWPNRSTETRCSQSSPSS